MFGQRLLALSFSLIVALLIFLYLPSITYQLPIHGESVDEIAKQLQEKEQEIAKLEGQLADSQKQEKTLNSQLNIIDSQTKLTQLRIEETNLKIEKLKREISDLSSRIDRISSSVDTLSEILLNRIVKTYKYGSTSSLDLIFSSHGISDLLERVKYIQVAQANDKKVLYQLQATKAAYRDQKQDKQTRQTEAEKLTKDLADYQTQLDQQKKAKEELLRVTRNDEARFQGLIAQLRADTESLARALSGGGVSLGDHNKGDRIAVVGNSGCSTGPHLHFEVMTPAHIEKAGDSYTIVGRENKVDPKPYLSDGRLGKPVSEYTGNEDCSNGGACHNGDISTRFGEIYFLGRHTGLDVVDYFGASIYAAESGTVYSFQDSQTCYLTGTRGKGVAVDHHNNIVTLYWHIP